jgi:pimeloyl-ACP methyl ester carboxylesterase
MPRSFPAALSGLMLLAACTHVRPGEATVSQPAEITVARGTRKIPVVLYGAHDTKPRKLAILAAGYGLGPTDYTFLASELVKRGFVVAALPSHLESDPPIPSGPDVATLRRPFWDNGVADIRQVMAELRSRGIAAPGRAVLVGHSHGGDISMLLAQHYPDEVRQVFSLDNRRVALPRTARPRICTMRSSDQTADPGVLPAPDEEKRFSMLIVPLVDQRHDDMWDTASARQKAAITAALGRCLDGR